MIHLYEYQNASAIPFEWGELETFLDEIWKNREISSYFLEEERSQGGQRFIQYLHKSREIRSSKYVGVIHFQGEKINLFPKIFHDPSQPTTDEKAVAIQQHLLWWLSYCKKIKFPAYQAPTSSTHQDFFEVLIYLFSKYTRELIHSSIFQQYEETERELSFVKGRIDITNYLQNQFGRGNAHKLPCIFDSFEMDNRFNRIVKYVANLLFRTTQNPENKRLLREILFIMDEVSDVPAKAEDCRNLRFNPMFGAFETVRDYCTLFLSNCVSFDFKNDLKLFAFLVPMEALFEDFLYGFLERELPEFKSKSQRSDTYLDEGKNFQIRPDLFIESPNKTWIADTKYKMVYHLHSDGRHGISQSDLYQMITYGIRFKIRDIALFYPNTVQNIGELEKSFTIVDELAEGAEISIQAFQVTIINHLLLSGAFDGKMGIKAIFEETTNNLRERLRTILLS